MYNKQSLTILATAAGLGLTFILLVGLHSVRAMPTATTWFVSPTGSGSACTQAAPCNLKTAADNAADNDTLYLSGGVYTTTESAVLKITTSITVFGGWNGLTGVLVVDPVAYPTILDGENARRVVYVTSFVTPTLEGLTLQYGNAIGQGGDPSVPGADVGGGVYAYDASPTISNCLVMSSTAGFGAGLALYKGTPVVINNVIKGNTALQNIASFTRGVGGGMLLYQTAGMVTNNQIVNNSANGTQVYDGGGGMYVDGSTTLISNNTIQGNYGYRGGGLFIYMSAINVNNNNISGNNAGLGGGVFLMSSPANFEANMVLANNSSMAGGGFAIFDSINFTLTNNIVAQNFGGYPAGLVASALFDFSSSQGVLVHNTFADNNAPPNPW
ncbi:MAG: right-handed parallel beta-helix repeat-containing protein, partial [Anaerolineales bacterium]|nr:right-handed parallel beta-helix repeat-containing protein [Anaerolineales bacterium]